MFPDYFRVPVGALRKTGLIGRFPKIGPPWNGAENSRPCVSCGGAHDDGSHGLKCLMGLRTVKKHHCIYLRVLGKTRLAAGRRKILLVRTTAVIRMVCHLIADISEI